MLSHSLPTFLLLFAGPSTSAHDKAVIANAAIFASATFGCGNLPSFLGERILADNFPGKSVVVREVMPQDLKQDGSNDLRTGSIGSTLSGGSGCERGRAADDGRGSPTVGCGAANKPLEESECSGVDALRRSPWKHVRMVSISMQCAKPISRAFWSGSRR